MLKPKLRNHVTTRWLIIYKLLIIVLCRKRLQH
ncbi:unnamed protein product [Thelazia callipaeda]|uniref:Uncharacterized protein n=1 Tax=Thelazia callipaeda TaxID=103827 RepID=A0A0N5CMS2_THECL|nr:unnamed protein product [Thelazia callipaeda]